MLAHGSLEPLAKKFPSQYRPILDLDMAGEWDRTVATCMVIEAARARGILDDARQMNGIRECFDEVWPGFGIAWENCSGNYIKILRESPADWKRGLSGEIAAHLLALTNKADAALKSSARTKEFIQPISQLILVSFGEFGNPQVGIESFLRKMLPKVEQKTGIDLGLGRKGMKDDPVTRNNIITTLFHMFATQMIDTIAGEIPKTAG